LLLARAQRLIGFYVFDDFACVAELREKPPHHRFYVGHDGLPLTLCSRAERQRLRIPDADRVVARTGDKLLTVGPPRQGIDIVFVAAKPGHRLERLGVPNPHIVISAAAGYAPAVRTVGGTK